MSKTLSILFTSPVDEVFMPLITEINNIKLRGACPNLHFDKKVSLACVEVPDELMFEDPKKFCACVTALKSIGAVDVKISDSSINSIGLFSRLMQSRNPTQVFSEQN